MDLRLYILNIILFLYQFEFIGSEDGDSGVILSVYRLGILPLLLLYVFRYREKWMKQDTQKYVIIVLFFLFSTISLVGYGYSSLLTTVVGNIAQFFMAYFYFQRKRIEKSTLWILTTWGIFQLPYFFQACQAGEVGLAHRFLGFHWDPNYLCMSLLVSFWAKVFLLKTSLKKFIWCFIVSVAVADVVMILFTLSRGGLLALFLTGCFYLFFYSKKLFALSSVFFAFLVSYMIARAEWVTWSDSLSLMDTIIYRIFVVAETGDISAGRMVFVGKFIQILENGEGIFCGVTLPYFIENINGGGYPHNSIIEILLSSGLLIGGLFYIFLIFQILKMIYISVKLKIYPFEMFFLISTLSVLMFLSFGLKICWLIVGMIFSLSNKNNFISKFSHGTISYYPCLQRRKIR